MAIQILPRPTTADVTKAGKKFDNENWPIEWTLTQLFQKFPANVDFAEVVVKTKVLNTLYSTQIRAVNIVARHIASLAIDPDLRAGRPEIVDKIAKVQLSNMTRNNFSFASKYCSWHKATAYPIYDSKVEACLWHYKKQDGFTTFRRYDHYDYAEFVRRVSAFRDFYGLTSFNFKELDKFLYYQAALLPKRQGKKRP